MLNELLGWLRKPVKLPQRHMTCAELARRIAAGEKWRLVVCYDCRERINPEDDDAFICIECGGKEPPHWYAQQQR